MRVIHLVPILALLVAQQGPQLAMAQQPAAPPATPPVSSTDVGNWGLVPFSSVVSVPLTAESRRVLRELEDRHLAQLRDLEDRYDRELLAIRARQAQERAELIASFAP